MIVCIYSQSCVCVCVGVLIRQDVDWVLNANRLPLGEFSTLLFHTAALWVQCQRQLIIHTNKSGVIVVDLSLWLQRFSRRLFYRFVCLLTGGPLKINVLFVFFCLLLLSTLVWVHYLPTSWCLQSNPKSLSLMVIILALSKFIVFVYSLQTLSLLSVCV